MKQTKIVATIGPASWDRATLTKLVKAGMDVARLNMSHGTHAEKKKTIELIRSVATATKKPIAILFDLQGPRIRVGDLPEEGVELKLGAKIVLSTEPKPANGYIPVTYSNMHRDLKRGDHILLADGSMEVVIEKVAGRNMFCKVLLAGTLKSHKGINVPKATLHVSPITTKDKKDLVFAIENNVDYIAMSFVTRARDIRNIRAMIAKEEQRLGVTKTKDLINRNSTQTRIVAKIEKHEAIDNFQEIVKEVDAVMVARGDLGLETPIEQLPIEQKSLIAQCLDHAIPVITATQMLVSMTEKPRPTRAEVSDVANAVIDHTDAVMLSEESAQGKYPVGAVDMMARIIDRTETSRYDDIVLRHNQRGEIETLDGVTAAAADLALSISAKAIVIATISGYTARLLSRFREELPLIAVVPTKKVQQQLSLVWGVIPILAPNVKSVQDLVDAAMPAVRQSKLLKKGDRVVMVAGHPTKGSDDFNILKIDRV